MSVAARRSTVVRLSGTAAVAATLALPAMPATAAPAKRAPACRGAQALASTACNAGSPGRVRPSAERGTFDRCTDLPGPPARCAFGVSPRRAKRTVALLGDSHALHWRSALRVAALRERWRGISLTGPGCFFSAAVTFLYPGAREPCVDTYRQTRRFLQAHKEITTVFVSASVRQAVIPEAGPQDEVKRKGFRDAYTSLPPHVKRVIVLRDPPMNSPENFACVKQAVRARTNANAACPLPRSEAITEDAAASAATGLGSPRYVVADFNDLFCRASACQKVVGGIRIYRDGFGHLTDAYSASLGPYVQRRVRQLLGR